MEASGGWSEEKLCLGLKSTSLTVWELIDLLGTGCLSKGLSQHTLSMGISEVFHELILDVLKQVGQHLQVMWSEQRSCNIEYGDEALELLDVPLSRSHFQPLALVSPPGSSV